MQCETIRPVPGSLLLPSNETSSQMYMLHDCKLAVPTMHASSKSAQHVHMPSSIPVRAAYSTRSSSV